MNTVVIYMFCLWIYKKYFHWSVNGTYIMHSVLNHTVTWLKPGEGAYACASFSEDLPTSNTHRHTDTDPCTLTFRRFLNSPTCGTSLGNSVVEVVSCTVELSLTVSLKVAYSIHVWRNSVCWGSKLVQCWQRQDKTRRGICNGVQWNSNGLDKLTPRS
jgi:hypothetical protein